jgi:uncharacterized protein involved in outer membrane biogenesis
VKKLAWIFGGLFIAMTVALVSVPLFVNVDQYRGTITEEANKRIQGKLELGKLNLSLWGAIKIHAESIKLSVKGFPDPMVETKNFHIEIPYLSVLSGKPKVIAVLEEPKILLVKEADGRLNLLELAKKPTQSVQVIEENSALAMKVEDLVVMESAAPEKKSSKSEKAADKAKSETAVQEPAAVQETEQAASTAATTAATTAPKVSNAAAEPTKVPAILSGATLGLRIEKGELQYTDKVSKSKYDVNGLEFVGENLGLGATMKISLLAPVKGQRADGKFDGPIKLQSELTPVLVDQVVKSVRGDVEVDASGMAMSMPGKIEKPAGMPLTIKSKFDGDEKETLLKQLDVRMHEAVLHAKGRIIANPLNVKIDMNSDPLKLESLEDFLPLLKDYDLKGNLNFNALVDYTVEKTKVSGDLKVTEGGFFYKKVFLAPMQFQLQAGFSENSLNVTRAAMAGPDTDLQLVGNVKNFLAPQFSFALSGKSFNVDKTLVLPSAKEKQAWLQIIPAAYAAEKGNPLLWMPSNSIVSGASGVFAGQIAKVTAYGSQFDQVIVKAQLQNLLVRVTEASVKMFGGSIKSTGDFDLRNPGLKYNSKGNASGISAKEALKTYFPKFQNTFEGTMQADWNLGGLAYPEAIRMKSIKGKAKIVATDGALKSVDFQSQINSTMQKVPFLKDKKPIEIDDGFKSMSAELTFDNGNIKVDPIDVQPRNKGFVVKGKSSILESLEQESFFDIYDPQGRLPKEFQSKSGKPAIALRLYGPLMSPKTDYDYTVKKLASGAGVNVAKDAAGKLLDKVLGGEKSGGSGDALKDAADKLKKKFNLFK